MQIRKRFRCSRGLGFRDTYTVWCSSFAKGRGPADKESEDTSGGYDDGGEDSDTSDEEIKDQIRSTGYEFTEDSDNDTDTGNSDNEKPIFNTSNITETSAYTGKPLTLKELYDNQDDLSSLLSKKQSSTRTETRTVPLDIKILVINTQLLLLKKVTHLLIQ